MVPKFRERFNREFTPDRHRATHAGLEARCGGPVEFRLSETPCFLPGSVARALVDVSHELIAQLLDNPAYLQAAEAIVPPELRLPSGEAKPTFIQVDFGLVRGNDGIEGRLVEMQAFPSLYGFQLFLAEAACETWGCEGLSLFFGGLTREAYVDVVRQAIVGAHDPAEVVVLEIEPERQKTRPDFVATEALWGVRAVDLRSIEREGRRLFVRDGGRRSLVRRFYNRVIPDELARRDLSWPFDLRDDLDVEWAGGPDWYCRMSKFALPWLDHPWVPTTRPLTDAAGLPADRQSWVLKPLLSFAGGGIIFAPTDEDLAAIPAADRDRFVVQERVAFTPLVETPHGPTQVEVRVMLVRTAEGYQAVIPLGRMGRGLMMGVDHNKGLEWVGATAVLIDEAS